MKIVIVGGGISGVSIAYLLSKHTNHDVLLIEKDDKIGGKAATFEDSGYVIETGPNGFLDNKKEIRALIEEAEFEDNVIESKDESKKRFIFSCGKLHELPENPIKLLYGDFLTPLGILRILKEPFIKPVIDDETLENFVERRLGREMLNKLIGPMACGIYAGNPRDMSMDSTFSRIKDIERHYGSLIRGLLWLMKHKRADTSSTSGPFSAKLMSFKDGIGSFIVHLSESLKIRNDEVLSIEKKSSSYRLHTKKGYLDSDCVIFAVPSYELSKIVYNVDVDFAKSLDGLEYAPLSVVSFGFDKNKMPEIVNSFGYLFNLDDIEDTIGVLFDSSIFDFRAKADKVLVRLMIGGSIKKQSAFAEHIYKVAIKELQRSASIFYPFEYSYVKRHAKAIPQYGMNHKEILKYAKEFEKQNEGVFIGGNAFYGVSLNDCVKSSYELLNKIV